MRILSIWASAGLLTVASASAAQKMPSGWLEVPGIGAKKYEHSGNATILALETPQKKLTLKKYFPVAQKQTAKTAGCPGLGSAIPEPIFDGQALFAFSQEDVGRCFVLIGISNGTMFTKIAIERNGGNTNVADFAKQLLAKDLGYTIPASAIASSSGTTERPQTAVLAKTPVSASVPAIPIGGRTKTPGFPANYTEAQKCISYQDLVQLKTVYLATNMDISTRALLIKKLSGIGTIDIVSSPKMAELLVEVNPVADGGTQLALWAVASRPSAGKPGTRCNVMPNTKPSAQQVIDELGQYLIILGGSRRGPGKAVISPYRMSPTGFPDYVNGPYTDRILCYKRIPNEEILQFRNIYIAANTPPDLRKMLTDSIYATGKYTVVDDAMNANYLVTFDRDMISQTIRSKEPDRIATVDNDPTSTAMGMPTGTHEVFIPGQVSYSTTRFEIASLTVKGVKHPDKPGEKGVICGIYYKEASKIRGLGGIAMKNPGKKVTAELIKFLNNPDLSYSDFPPEVLEAFAK